MSGPRGFTDCWMWRGIVVNGSNGVFPSMASFGLHNSTRLTGLGLALP